MAISFPENPNAGDTYVIGQNTFVFDGDIWQLAAARGRTFNVTLNTSIQETAPTSPNPGDIWLNSTTGQGFVYFDDGDTTQWVDIAQPGPTGARGYTGSQGPPEGYTGSQGIQGFAGSAAPPEGYTGSQGFTGSRGPPEGYTGSQGFTGSQGDTSLVQAVGFAIALGG